jgi:polyhydroxyalkanoate synthesis regulator phasin
MATKRSPAGDAADAVRTAVDRTVQATVGQAQQLRETLDLRALNERVAELERRVKKLERAGRKSRS